MNTKMKKVYVQVVDTTNGISQNGMIEEPVKEGLEISNALAHFGVNYGLVEWSKTYFNNVKLMTGIVQDTSKVVSVIAIS